MASRVTTELDELYSSLLNHVLYAAKVISSGHILVFTVNDQRRYTDGGAGSRFVLVAMRHLAAK